LRTTNGKTGGVREDASLQAASKDTAVARMEEDGSFIVCLNLSCPIRSVTSNVMYPTGDRDAGTLPEMRGRTGVQLEFDQIGDVTR